MAGTAKGKRRSPMANLLEWIKQYCEENNETVEAFAVGDLGWSGYGKVKVPKEYWGKLLTADRLHLLDYKFDPRWGAPKSHAIYVWTDKSVLFIVQYDGSESLESIPRNPTACMPEMPGG